MIEMFCGEIINGFQLSILNESTKRHFSEVVDSLSAKWNIRIREIRETTIWNDWPDHSLIKLIIYVNPAAQ